MHHLPYRPCVGIMLVNHLDLVMIGRRVVEAGPEHVDDTHAWQMPQGGIDPGEEPLAAALRAPAPVRSRAAMWAFYVPTMVGVVLLSAFMCASAR